MSAMRSGPVRRPPSGRPPWLTAVIIAVGVLVVFAVVFAVWNALRKDSAPSAEQSVDASASPCVTATVATSKVLPLPSQVRINVYNSTSKTGLAKKTARALSQKGFKISKVSNDPLKKKIEGVAQIRYGPKGELSAQLLLLYVPGAEMVNDYRTGKKIDLSTGTTFSGLSPQQGVNALLAAPTPVASGAGCTPIDGTTVIGPSSAPVGDPSPSATP